MSRKRVPLNQNECTDDFRIGVLFEQNLHNMDKTKRWLERQVMPSLLMIKEIEKKTGANYLEEIDRHTRLTEKQELKIKQMTTDIADMIEKDTAVPQGNDGIF